MEGGLEVFDESWLSRASRAPIRCSKDRTKARMAAWTSAGVLAQRSAGSGGLALMPSDVIDRGQWRKPLLAVNGYRWETL